MVRDSRPQARNIKYAHDAVQSLHVARERILDAQLRFAITPGFVELYHACRDATDLVFQTETDARELIDMIRDSIDAGVVIPGQEDSNADS